MGERADWQAAYEQDGFVEFPANRLRMTSWWAGAAAAFLAGVVLIAVLDPLTVAAGVVLVGLGTVLAIVAVRTAARGRPTLRIDRLGLAVDDERVDWPDITAIKSSRPGAPRRLVVGLTPYAARRLRGELGGIRRRLVPRDSPAVRGPAVFLPTDNGYVVGEMASWLGDVHEAARRRPDAPPG